MESPGRASIRSPQRGFNSAQRSYNSPHRSYNSPSRASLLSPSRLRKAPKIGLSDQELQGLREAFSLFDVDGSGVIDPKELKAELDALGFSSKSPSVYWFVSQLAAEYSTLTIDQCITAMESRLAYTRQSREVSDKVFDTLLDDKKSALTADRLRKVAKEVGEDLSDSDIQEMLKAAAKNGEEVTRDDFYSLLVKKPHT